MTWDKNWMTLGLGGVVDGRSIRDKQGFDALDANFRRIAEEQFRQFDGRRSAISRNEIERRIRLQMKQEGLVIENLPADIPVGFLCFFPFDPPGIPVVDLEGDKNADHHQKDLAGGIEQILL